MRALSGNGAFLEQIENGNIFDREGDWDYFDHLGTEHGKLGFEDGCDVGPKNRNVVRS